MGYLGCFDNSTDISLLCRMMAIPTILILVQELNTPMRKLMQHMRNSRDIILVSSLINLGLSPNCLLGGYAIERLSVSLRATFDCT